MKDNIWKCRLCLDECDSRDEMFELFANGEYTNSPSNELKLFEKVENCCGVRIRESPEMPTNICFKCFDITRVWVNFQQMVLNSQVYLESLCTDRKRPPEYENDEVKYINYLLTDLQRVTEKNQTYANIYDINDDFFNDDIFKIDLNNSDTRLVDKDENSVEGTACEIDNLSLNGINEENIEIESKHSQQVAVAIKSAQQQETQPMENFKKHVRPQSPTTFMCTICGNVYQKKSSFKYHMSLHSNIKPHQCEICNKSFRQLSDVKNHMRRHTGEKPYQCTYCERRFIDRSEKHRHERVHTNSRPYKCKICDKTFSYSTTLKNHVKLHSGQKDFTCLVCNKSFSLQHQLKAHMRTLTHKQQESQFVAAGYEVLYE